MRWTVTGLQAAIAKWQRKTFGSNHQNINGVYSHLLKEVYELGEIIKCLKNYDCFTYQKNMNVLRYELADCFIMLVGLADAYKIDLEKATVEKMYINKTRQWKTPDSDGVIEHKD